jgi:hypothetical protein
MFCPQCGSTQSEDLKFCKQCGANMSAVRQAMMTREEGEKFDWSKTWVAEMFMSGQEALKRKAELERLQGLTPEVKRYNEIKAGVIVSSVGVALMIFLYVFMQGIVVGGKIPADTAEIISRIWIAGVIPFFVGLGLLINGIVVSKRIVEAARREELSRARETGALEGGAQPRSLQSADTTEFIPSNFSVTEGTTKHLPTPSQKS